MFIGSFPFGGMLGSFRREGMCMLLLISEKGKLIMLIKQALAYVNKSVTLKTFKNKWFDWRGTYQRRNELKYEGHPVSSDNGLISLKLLL